MSLISAVCRAAQVHASGIALLGAGRPVTWRELEQRVARVAGSLKVMGVKPGARVATLATNSPAYFELLLALWWCGAVIVPLNTRLAAGEISYILEHSDVAMLLVDDDMTGLARQAESRRFPTFVVDTRFHDTLLQGAPVDVASPEFEATAGIFYTGGTTGVPKGVELSHRNFAAAAAGMLRDLQIDSSCVYLHAAPMFHLADFGVGMGVTMGAGAHSFLAKFTPGAFYERLKEHAVTHLNLVPTMLAAVLEAPCRDDALLAKVRRICYGAAPISIALLEKVLQAFPNAAINQFYGMTETCGASVFLAPQRHVLNGPLAGKLKSAGQVIPGFQLLVADEAGVGVPAGTVGEILIKGPAVMKGYLRDPTQTAHALRGGWLHSGDAGYLDDEGFLFLVDRMKDMIISGGENIYCTEVENALASHPHVQACAVLGLPDEKWGERVHAVVVAMPGTNITEVDLDAHVRSLLAGYKVPKSYEFSETLPLSGVGKVQKKALRDKWLQAAGRPA